MTGRSERGLGAPSPGSTDTRVGVGVQPTPAPWQVSRRNMSSAPLPSLPTSVGALEVKTTKRPSALTAGSRLDPVTSGPPVASETRVVVGVQAGVKGAPMQVSRRKMSAKPLVSFPAPMGFVAEDMKAT